MSHLPALGPRGEGWVAGQVVLIAAIGLLGLPGFRRLPPDTPGGWVALLAGLVLLVAGLALGARGIRDLGRNLTAVPRPRADAELVEIGVYRSIRHPVYAGLVVAAFGWSLAVASPPAAAGAAALALWLDAKARREEVWLEHRYAAYRAYRARTHRFIPRIY